MTIHDLATAILFFILGWIGRTANERQSTPRKREKAIPMGTQTKRRPGRPRKAIAAQEAQPELTFTIESGIVTDRTHDHEPRP